MSFLTISSSYLQGFCGHDKNGKEIDPLFAECDILMLVRRVLNMQ